MAQGPTRGVPIDIDGTLANNSDLLVPSQKAVVTYVTSGLSSKQNALGFTPLNRAGDTMLGNLLLSSNPTLALQAATKDYVDTLINGIDWKQSAVAATVAALPAYTVSGSGTILTGNANGAIPSATTDGITLAATNRVLVKNETSTLTPNNGIYVVTQVGNGSTPFILTRADDANVSSELAEATISIYSGATLSNTQWHCNPASVPITLGTTYITFAQIGSGTYTATLPISITGNIISISQATTSTNGYLTSTDWNTFNNKQAALSGTGIVKSTAGTISYISGTGSQFVKGDGSLDSSSYLTGASTISFSTDVTTIGSQTLGGSISVKVVGLNGSLLPTLGTTAGLLKWTGATGTWILDSNNYLTTSSASSTYVPYTGATTNVLLGNYYLQSEVGLRVKPSYTSNWVAALSHAGNLTTSKGTLVLRENSTGGGFDVTLSSLALTASRSIDLPNKDGTVALTSDIPTLSTLGGVPSIRTLTINGTALDLSADRSWSVGTVTSVGLSLPAIFTITVSPVTTSGTLTATLASQTANTFFAAPNGAAGTPTFRAIVAADIPSLAYVTSVSGTGTVSGLTLTGTVTTSGNITLGGTLSVLPSNFATQTANTVLAGPTTGVAATPTFRALVAADIPALSYLTAEADTLATVTGRGATTSTASTFSAGITVGGVGITYNGATSGSTILKASAAAGSTTITMPATTGTMALLTDIPTVNNGTLTLSIGTAGATNTTVTVGTGTGFSANTATNATYSLSVGPAITALATLMATAGAGFIRRGATADTFSIDTNTYQTLSTNLTSLAGLTYVSGTYFVKMTGANTFALDSATYLTAAITSLGGQTGATQTFATGTSGTDFGISSATNTHTFNLPVASGTNTGKLSNTDWSTFNNKQAAITLTTTGSSGSATFVSNTLNIPTYTLAGLGGLSNPMTTLGDIIYGGASGVVTRLAGQATNGIYFLRENVTASAAVAPDWIGSTGSGNVVLATSASLTTPSLSGETFSTSAAVTAGTNAQGQGPLTSDFNVVTTTAANPSGVTLPTATIGRRVVISNRGTNSVSVYPATGAAIDALAANQSTTLPVNSTIIFNASSATQWYTFSSITTSINFSTTGLTPNVATSGAVTVGGTLVLANGGTNANLTATAGGIVYSTASALAISTAGSANQVLLSGGTGTPTWASQNTITAGSVQNSFIIKADTGTTEGTDLYTFTGSAAKTLNIVAGTNITITKTAGQWSIASAGGSAPGYLKTSVRVATTANVATLAGGAPLVVDSVSLVANDRVLVKDQTTLTQNGIYVVTTPGTGANGTWTRATDADTDAEMIGAVVTVDGGTTQGGELFKSYFPTGGTLAGTNNPFWEVVTTRDIKTGLATNSAGITLNQYSALTQIYNGTADATYVLPNNIVAGAYFRIVNDTAQYNLTINTSGGSTITTIGPSSSAIFTARITNPTAVTDFYVEFLGKSIYGKVAAGTNFSATTTFISASNKTNTPSVPAAASYTFWTAPANFFWSTVKRIRYTTTYLVTAHSAATNNLVVRMFWVPNASTWSAPTSTSVVLNSVQIVLPTSTNVTLSSWGIEVSFEMIILTSTTITSNLRINGAVTTSAGFTTTLTGTTNPTTAPPVTTTYPVNNANSIEAISLANFGSVNGPTYNFGVQNSLGIQFLYTTAPATAGSYTLSLTPRYMNIETF